MNSTRKTALETYAETINTKVTSEQLKKLESDNEWRERTRDWVADFINESKGAEKLMGIQLAVELTK